jgi:Transposase C of IS166 homeodomain
VSISEAEQIAQLKQQLQWAELKIQVLEERLRLQLMAKYGTASEKLNDAQLELLEQEPGVSHTEVEAESERAAEPVVAPARERRPHPGRQQLRRLICPGGRKSCRVRRNIVPARRADTRPSSSATSKTSSWMWSRRVTSCW